MPQASALLSYSDLTAVIYQVKHRLKALTLIRKFDISLWFPCGAYGLAYGQVITKISRIRHLHISHNAPFLSPLPPPQKNKFWITLVFHFSWVLQPSQEKLKTMLMQNLGVEGADKVHYGKCASGEWTDYQIFLGMGFRDAHAWSSAIGS